MDKYELMEHLIFVFAILLLSLSAFAQGMYIISSYMESGGRLIGATVYLPQMQKGTITSPYSQPSLLFMKPRQTQAIQPFSFCPFWHIEVGVLMVL